MKEKYIILNNLDELAKEKNYISEGENGICYRVGDQVFKLFKVKPLFIYFLKSIAQIDSKSLIFPNEFVYQNIYNDANLKGYLMDFIEGTRLIDIDGLLNIKEFIIKLDLLEKEIKALTKEHGLLIRDIHPFNIILTLNNELKVIDNDNDVINSLDDFYENYKSNMNELGEAILPFILRGGDLISENVNKLYIECILQGKCKPSIVLYEAIKVIEEYKKEEINTLHDMHEGIKLIINK